MEETAQVTARLEWLLLEGLKSENRDPNQAITLADEAIQLSKDHPNPSLYARALRNLAYSQHACGAPEQARETLAKAYQLAERSGDWSATALCLHTQGLFFYFEGKLLQAVDSYRKAANYREALQENSLLAGTLNNLGATYLNLGDYDSCLETHRRALQLWRATENRFGEAFTLNNIGIVYSVFEDFDAALHYHHEARALAEQAESLALQCDASMLIARTLRRSRALEEAEKHLQLAFALAISLPEPRRQASLQEEQGLLLKAQGDYQASRKALCRALSLFRSLHNHIDITRLLHEIGALHLAQNRPQRACRTLERCCRLAETFNLKQIERDACSTLADAFEALEDTRSALRYHRRFHQRDRELLDESRERQRLRLLRQIELEKAQQEAELQRVRNEELAEAQRRLEEANALLTELANRDGMTGLINHRAFQEQLRTTISQEAPTVTGLLLIDVDHFKDFNDTFGHPAGDEVLKQVAQLLRQSVREQDFIGRYGGEEFAVLLPDTEFTIAEVIAERIRRAIAEHTFPQRQVTVSIGITTTLYSGTDPTQLIHDADQALYAAKRLGRNCTLRAA